ncbi:MAG: hypothetical protein LBQ59_01005 [Candidatus Peribacteria bacterium]|jgi:hypothetical protein|nr:hypothetical protein [Candidatus Peribacteria bacterium]
MSKKVVCSFKPEEKKPINCGLATNFTFKVPENYDPLQQVDKEVVADIAETI